MPRLFPFMPQGSPSDGTSPSTGDPQGGWQTMVGDDALAQLPPAASSFTESVDGVFYFTLWLCGIFFFLILGLLLYAVVRYRRKTEEQPPASMTTHNTALEVTWTVIPLVLIMILFAWGWRGVMDMTTAPAGALSYEVQGRQWSWGVKHPGDKSYVTLSPDNPAPVKMYVPVNKNVKVVMHSTDVLHSFYIPAFRIKRDVLPGRNQMIWFKATVPGTYPILCAEYCGDSHSYMLGTVEVCSEERFAERPWAVRPEDPVEWGAQLYAANCKSCHSLDGSVIVGPSWKGLYGSQRQLADGSQVTADDAYITESVRMPQAKIAKGFVGQNMTAYSEEMIDNEALQAIIAFMKEQK